MGRKKKELKQRVRVPLKSIALKAGTVPETYPDEQIAALAGAMAEDGLQEPILLKGVEGKGPHKLLAGMRRLLAAQRLGWEAIDALLLDGSFAPEIRLIETLQQNALGPWEAADALARLKARLDWTQTQLGQAAGRNRDFAANILAITQIAPEVRAYILAQENGHALSARHLRYVGRAPESDQLRIAQRILASRLSTTVLERGRRGGTPPLAPFRFHNLRELRKAGSASFPRTLKEWRKYFRQLTTDLRRLERQEQLESVRTRKRILEIRQRQQLMRKEAGRKRRELLRELRGARRHLGMRTR